MEKNLFHRFLITYLVILIIPCLALAFLYQHSSALLEEKILRSELALLEQTKTYLDSKLETVDTFVRHNLQDTSLARALYIREPLDAGNVVLVREIKNSLSVQTGDGDMVLDWFALIDESNFVLGPKTAYQIDRFYGYYYSYGDIPCELWRQDKFGRYHAGTLSPASSALLENRRVRVMEYTVSYPVYRARKAVITALVDADLVRSYLTSYSGGERTAYLFDSGGTLLLSTGGAAPEGVLESLGDSTSARLSTEEGAMLVTTVQSAETGLRYVSTVSSDLSLRELREFQALILLMIAGVAGLTLLVSLRFAKSNTRPIRSLINENTTLSDTIQRQMPLLQASFMEKLFLGQYASDREIEENMDWLDIPRAGTLFAAAAVSVELGGLGVQALNDEMVTILSRVKLAVADPAYRGLSCYAGLMGKSEIGLLLSWEDEDGEAFEQSAAEALKRLVHEVTEREKHVGIGGICDRRSALSQSYFEALHTIRYFSIHQSEKILHLFREIPQAVSSYYYPPDTGFRFLGMIREGNSEGVQELLREIYTENIMNRELSPALLDILTGNLWGIILDVAGSGLADDGVRSRVDAAVAQFTELSLLEKLQTCTGLFEELCAGVQRQKSLGSGRKAQDIMDYVNENYRDPDLSLGQLTDLFNISESHLSASFKEWTGANFYNFLQDLRIREAARLLSDTELSMQEIAGETGYSSYNTFARAFKRTMGISATAYREKAASQK